MNKQEFYIMQVPRQAHDGRIVYKTEIVPKGESELKPFEHGDSIHDWHLVYVAPGTQALKLKDPKVEALKYEAMLRRMKARENPEDTARIDRLIEEAERRADAS